MAGMSDAVVIGAGIAGASTALSLRRRGLSVTLVDVREPGHARAASAGDHRILRASHGSDELYTRWSREARLRWMELGAEVGQELFVQAGAVMLARAGHTAWEDASRDTLAALGIPSFVVDVDELRLRLPLIDPRGLAYGLWEPESGFVYARRATQATARRFVELGGVLQRGVGGTDGQERPLVDGRPIDADVIVFACGAWMGGLFPRTLGRLLEIVRQDVMMVEPPPGSTGYDAENFPAWIDHGYPAYGIPATGGYGFKAVINWRGLNDRHRPRRPVDRADLGGPDPPVPGPPLPGAGRRADRRPGGRTDRQHHRHPLPDRPSPDPRARRAGGRRLRAPVQARAGGRRPHR